jgi:hypothetical protein
VQQLEKDKGKIDQQASGNPAEQLDSATPAQPAQ